MKSRNCSKSLSDIATIHPFSSVRCCCSQKGLTDRAAIATLDKSHRINNQGHAAITQNSGTCDSGYVGQVVAERFDGNLLLPDQTCYHQPHPLVSASNY